MINPIYIPPPQFNFQLSASELECAISPKSTMSICALEKKFLIKNLATHGVIKLSQFCSSKKAFSQFSDTFFSKTTTDPGRQQVSPNTQYVNIGSAAIDPHCENATTPYRPDCIAFYYDNAPRYGSQTTLCDGEEVFRNLPASTRYFLLRNKFKFSRRLPANVWKFYVQKALGRVKSIQEITLNDLNRLPTTGIEHRYIPCDNGDIILEVIVPLVDSSLFSGNPAYANSLQGPSQNHAAPTITLADDTAVPGEILSDIHCIVDHCTWEADVQTGDVLLIDNSRFMHGRRKIIDPARRVLVAMGDI